VKKGIAALPARAGAFLALCLPVALMAGLWGAAFFVW
jgi:hypothetical protein